MRDVRACAAPLDQRVSRERRAVHHELHRCGVNAGTAQQFGDPLQHTLLGRAGCCQDLGCRESFGAGKCDVGESAADIDSETYGQIWHAKRE